MAKKLFVGGLSWGTTEDALRNAFAAVGTVESAVVVTDKFSGRSKGFGFVEMATDEEAAKAVAEFNGKELDGRVVTVSEARPMADRPPREEAA
jgi:cold-inducible RNA-binding protein